MEVKAFGVKKINDKLQELNIKRRNVLENDVEIDIHYCGVCHSDIHHVEGDWGEIPLPAVPGHEIVGIVKSVGEKVNSFKVGDKVGVGCMVDSCQTCTPCEEDHEQFCENLSTQTYGSSDPHLGGHTYGGYSQSIVVNENFVLRVAEKMDFEKVAPLLCAGITTYSPLRHWNIKSGDKVAVVGLGGLGHMGVKIAAAMGAEVTMITRSESKVKDAKELGASKVLISTDPEQMKNYSESFDFILNTIPVNHDLNPYVQLLKPNKTMVLVGYFGALEAVSAAGLVLRRKSIAGSLIGGIKETQEMLDFCAEHNIHPDIELIDTKDVNDAFVRVKKSDVKYRFVLDIKTLN